MLTQKILLVEPDDNLATYISKSLNRFSYKIERAADHKEFRHHSRSQVYDVIICNINLPDGHGYDIIREVKGCSTSSIIMVSTEEHIYEVAIAFELGADNFLPLDTLESLLLPCVRNACRRQVDLKNEKPKIQEVENLYFDGWCLNLPGRTLFNEGGNKIELTKTEFDVLEIFLINKNKVLSRDTIIEKLRGFDWAGYDRAIDGIVSRLRSKMTSDHSTEVKIEAVRGIGYKLVVASDDKPKTKLPEKKKRDSLKAFNNLGT